MATIQLEGAPAWSRQRRIGHYGGALDKRNAARETRPYAYTWYLQIQVLRGSAYTKAPGTLVHVENLAIARLFAGISRAAERLVANSIPLTADERLRYWTEVMAIPVENGDTRQEVRLRAAAKWQAASGSDQAAVDAAVSRLLGSNLVRVWRWDGTDLTTPPKPTFWPGINDGPTGYDLGGGTWISRRAHLTIEVKRIAGQSLAEFLHLMNRSLFNLLDPMLDSHVTWNWATGSVEDGFILGESLLGFDAFGPG
jgi:hypothetical protein